MLPGPVLSAARTVAIRRAATRLCITLGWAPLHEVTVPNGRRCDLLALRPDGGFVCIEVKSGPRDYLADAKWREYRNYCDALYFAVDEDFPQSLLPDEAGLIVACIASPAEPELVRAAPSHPLAASRRRALMLQFARLAAERLAALDDPASFREARAALRSE